MFKYKIQKRGGVYRVYITKIITPAQYLTFVCGWLFVITTMGIGFLLLAFAEMMTSRYVTETLIFPKQEWEWATNLSTLEEAMMWVDNHKEEQREVYYL